MGCCQTLTGILRDCESNIGGIKRAWIACYDNVSSPTVADEMITAIGTPTTEWHEFEFKKQTGSVTTTITKDDTTGSLYYESVIVLQFARQETSKRIEINSLAISDLAIIIQDNNNRYWYLGYDWGVTLTDGTAETGTAFTDLNGYNITLTDVSRELPYEVTDEAMQPLLTEEPEG